MIDQWLGWFSFEVTKTEIFCTFIVHNREDVLGRDGMTLPHSQDRDRGGCPRLRPTNPPKAFLTHHRHNRARPPERPKWQPPLQSSTAPPTYQAPPL